MEFKKKYGFLFARVDWSFDIYFQGFVIFFFTSSAMRNCAKETEHERDHIVIPKNTNEGTNALPSRRQTISNGSGLSGICNGEFNIFHRFYL